MKLTELIDTRSIVAPLQVDTRDDVVASLVNAALAAAPEAQDLRDDLVARVLEREAKGSTGFGKGVAVPHAKHPGLPRLVGALGLSPRGVDFKALDKGPVFSVFLLLSPQDEPDRHLEAMEHVFGKLQDETFRKFLRQASTPAEAMDLLQETDAEQPAR